MITINSDGGVFSYIVEEHEWYGVSEAEREYLQMRAMLAAQEAKCLYVSIFVEPDELFSASPVAKRHRVFTHTFDRPIADEFYRDLIALAAKYVQPGKLTIAQAKTIALKAYS